MKSAESEVMVYRGSLMDAQRAWSMLTGHGIPARVASGTLGATYGSGSVPVLVRSSDARSAQDVLAASGLVHVEGQREET